MSDGTGLIAPEEIESRVRSDQKAGQIALRTRP